MNHINNFFNYVFKSPDIPTFALLLLLTGLVTAFITININFLLWTFSWAAFRSLLLALVLTAPAIYTYLNRPKDTTDD